MEDRVTGRTAEEGGKEKVIKRWSDPGNVAVTMKVIRIWRNPVKVGSLHLS